MEFIERPCPICNQDKTSSLFSDACYDFKKLDDFAFASRKTPEYMHFRLLLCSSCDLLYASPIPNFSDLKNLYQDADFDSQNESKLAASSYASALKKNLNLLPNKKSALDIGAGDGAFLKELLELNFETVIGIEPSIKPVQQASPEIKPFIRIETFDKGKFQKDSFSLVTLFQTIEHIDDPDSVIKEIHHILEKNGVFMIVCHNRNALSAKILGKKSPIFDVEHLQLFSSKSISKILKNSGFSKTNIHTFYNTYPLQYWARLFPFPKIIKKFILKILSITKIGKIPVPLPAGNLVVFAVK